MDVENWLQVLKKGLILSEREVKQLCLKIIELLCEVFKKKIFKLRNLTYNL
jgi:hypothetical protein